jgi:hypothetical protein
MEPRTNGVPRIEIEESKIVINGNNIIWMFGIIVFRIKKLEFLCVKNDRTTGNILQIKENNNYSLKRRIYSDSFSSY